MSFESLSHSPTFELPDSAPPPPADLIALIEECHEGLAKAIVSKMIRRGKYDQIATITCQENPSKKSHPTASSDDIAEYCMMCMQYEMEKSDEPGSYKVTLFGPPGKGRFERSKHVEFGEGGEAHSKSMLSEGDLLEQQQNYIGELHSQMIAMHETLQGMVKPLMSENKEMMKIVSESQRRLADVEAQRLRHDLELKIHADEVKQRELEQEQKMERWRELLGVVKDTGAFEAIVKAVAKKLKDAESAAKKNKEKQKEKDKEKDEKPEDKSPEPKDKPRSLESSESKVEQAKKKQGLPTKKKKKKKKGKLIDLDASSEQTVKEMTEEELHDALVEEGMEKAIQSPLLLTIEMLKMSIDNNNQWKVVEDTLSEEQMKLLREIVDCGDEKAAEKKLKALYQMKGSRRLLKLEDHMDDEQQKFVDILLEVAMS